jgi:hypothetical protein
MLTWTLIRPDGLLEHVEAERIEDDSTGWSFWSVVLIINTPRWACVRRVIATDVLCAPMRS